MPGRLDRSGAGVPVRAGGVAPCGRARRVAWAETRRVPRIGAGNPAEPWEALVDADLDTLATALYARTDDLLKSLPGPQAAAAKDRVGPETLRRQADHARGAAGPARVHLRGPLAAVRPQASAAPVPLPAQAAWLQQAAAQTRGNDPLADRRTGPRHHGVDR